jgi:peptidoglycan hydrolase-like protein with peptidoglycan-binding domain
VVAINVGTYVQTRMLLDRGKVVRRYKSDSIANTAVSVTAFIPAMDVFSRARILERPDKIRALQAGLKSQGLYGGQIDGTFGPETRQAIQAFVGNPASEAAGLPTADLLATVTSLKPNRGGTDDQTAETKARSQTLSGGRLQRRIMPAARRPREESPTAPVRRP